MTTLATRTIDGINVLIIKEVNSIECSFIGTPTQAALEECQLIVAINSQAYFEAQRVQVKDPKPGLFHRLWAATRGR